MTFISSELLSQTLARHTSKKTVLAPSRSYVVDMLDPVPLTSDPQSVFHLNRSGAPDMSGTHEMAWPGLSKLPPVSSLASE